MEIYNDKNIRIELKNKNLSQEEIMAIYFWILTECGYTIEVPDSFFDLKGLIDEEDYLEELRS